MYIMTDQTPAKRYKCDRVERGAERIDSIINRFCKWLDDLVGRM